MKPANVLLLDDEATVLKLFNEVFHDEDYGVVSTMDPAKAMQIIEQGTIKVVISDQRMPATTGIDFLRNLKVQHPDIIRILLTGYTDYSVVAEAINVGEVYRYVSKPWTTTEFKSVIRQAIANFDLIQENRRLFHATQKKNEELELANKKLKAMYESQTEFTAVISHELRTPLSSIKMALDIILSGTSGALVDEQKTLLERAKGNSDRLKLLINDIVDFTKLKAGKFVFDVEFHDINALIEEVVTSYRSAAEQKGLELSVQLDPQAPKVPFDKEKLRQVFDNLLTNALKFTSKGGITIANSTRRESNHVEIIIKDTGIGIQPEDLPKAFQRFQRFSSPDNNPKKSTGLGLAICREIIKQHGGKIWVDSTVGGGTEFHFILPIQERRKE